MPILLLLKWFSNDMLYNSYSINMHVLLWIDICHINNIHMYPERKSDTSELLMNLNTDAEKFFVVFLRYSYKLEKASRQSKIK